MNRVKISDVGHGPIIVMVHGWGQTKKSFEPLAESLKEKFRVISFDLPGHGSAKEDGGPYTFMRYCDVLTGVINTLGDPPYHLLGWSMGGAIAALYSFNKLGRAPESLILLGATPKFVTTTHNLRLGQHPAAVKKMARLIMRDADSGLRDFVDRFFESGEKISEGERAQIEKIFYPPEFPPQKEALLSTLDELARTDLTQHSGRYDGPVLLIYGRLDKICPVGGQQLWKGLFDNLQEVCLESAGHAPHITRLPEVAESIKDFILKDG